MLLIKAFNKSIKVSMNVLNVDKMLIKGYW